MPASSSGVSLAELEAAIGYRFRDRRLPLEALTHRTYSHEHPGTAPDFNERLEFLGDAVLGLVVSEALFRRFPRGDEGMLSRMKAAVVRDRQLALTAGEIGLGRFVRLGRGEEKTGGRTKPSLMADAMEALFAAVYLDGGFEAAAEVIRRLLGPAVDRTARRGGIDDAKTALQEELHRRGLAQPQYRLCSESGPDHAKEFEVEVRVDDVVAGTGRGPNKKEAEKAAAAAALQWLAGRAGAPSGREEA